MMNLSMMRRALAPLLLLITATATVSAGEGEARLERFLDGLNTMRATFIQTIHDARGELVDKSEGTLAVERPGHFRLQYTNPYEQLYVADGKKVWMYDRDLEQVTVKEQEAAIGSTPALLLSSAEPLTQNFEINELGEHEGFLWLELNPKSADSNFDYVRLAIEGEVLRAMEMVDGFGQTTRLLFDTVERNPVLKPELFRFTPPPGVDVIGEGGE